MVCTGRLRALIGPHRIAGERFSYRPLFSSAGSPWRSPSMPWASTMAILSAIPTIQCGILLPILIGALLIWRSETVRRISTAVPQEWLVGVQLYRALGVVFLILYSTGKLPGLFAWPAGVGDIAIGLLAPIAGLAYARAPSKTAGLVRAWNLFGILDLIIAVGTGFLTAPSSFEPFVVQPTSELMTLLPMVLIRPTSCRCQSCCILPRSRN